MTTTDHDLHTLAMRAPGKCKWQQDDPSVGQSRIVTYIVYAIVFRSLNLVVYVGSTSRSEREDEHLRICGGARRVAVAFAQRWFQPVLDFFEFRELWRGECTSDEARGIEQHFIGKHETKVVQRSRDPCLARDLDLMQPDTVPRRLNLVNACTDPAVVTWAASRVKRDSAITVMLSPTERQHTSHLFEMTRVTFEADAEATMVVVVRRCIDKYTGMAPGSRVDATKVHTDLVRVYAALTGDDGVDARRCCRAKMLTFNVDHHGDETWSSVFVAAEFRAIHVAMGVVQATSVPSEPGVVGVASSTERHAVRNSWSGWIMSEPVARLAKQHRNLPSGAGKMELYCDITCPHCGDKIEALASSAKKNKVNICTAHLAQKQCNVPEEEHDADTAVLALPPSKRARTGVVVHQQCNRRIETLEQRVNGLERARDLMINTLADCFSLDRPLTHDNIVPKLQLYMHKQAPPTSALAVAPPAASTTTGYQEMMDTNMRLNAELNRSRERVRRVEEEKRCLETKYREALAANERLVRRQGSSAPRSRSPLLR